ncbi:DUF4399 domain-containing protein [Roseobacteraceae bacterium NS-SX3]
MKYIAAILAGVFALPGYAGDTAAPEGVEVYFGQLENGATVSSPVTVRFGLKGMGVAPAGVEHDNTGHHHLLIDLPAFGPDAAEMFGGGIPSDENHRHFGGGQTEAEIELAPGRHTLQLILGDAFHVPHADPVYSDQITITVK